MFSSRSSAIFAPLNYNIVSWLIFTDSWKPSIFAASKDYIKPVFNPEDVNKNKVYVRVPVFTSKYYFGWDRRRRRQENLETPGIFCPK